MDLQFVSAGNRDFLSLAQRLDEYYFELVGDVQRLYAGVNHPGNLASLVVGYEQGRAVAIGGWKALDGDTAEIKRIYVVPEHRRKGAASAVVRALERDIASSGRRRIVLETARNTPASAALYQSLGYRPADYYGSPAGACNSLCFQKDIG